MTDNIKLWTSLPAKTNNYSDISIAVNNSDVSNLTDQQKRQIIAAFQAGAYDMATEYTWKKAMVKLKELLASLGGEFISDMLQRSDINEFSSIESVLSDNDAILLSERLGILNGEGAMQLRHAKEQLSYYFSTKAEQQGTNLDEPHSLIIIIDCVKNILSIKTSSLHLEFSDFKQHLLESTIKETDELFKQIVDSTLFYLRTVCAILLSSIKKEKGAHVENASANLLTLLPHIWDKLSTEDKWNIGSVYKDVVADGNSIAATSIRNALMKVKGFDFVPENLRSETFKKAAHHLIEVHYEFNNFYNEPAAIKSLAHLGTIIPKPAFSICIRAYLVVYLGNYYGVSDGAQPIAIKELKNIHQDRWMYYWQQMIHQDLDVLYHLLHEHQVLRMHTLMTQLDLTNIPDLQSGNKYLYNAIISGRYSEAAEISKRMYNKLSGN